MVTVRPEFAEMTVLGAAIAAGLAAKVWNDTSQLPRTNTSVYEPRISPDGKGSLVGFMPSTLPSAL